MQASHDAEVENACFIAEVVQVASVDPSTLMAQLPFPI